MAPASPGARFSRSSLRSQASFQKRCLCLFQRFSFLLEKIGDCSMEAPLPDGPRLFLRSPYEVEGQSLTLMRAVFEDSVRSTESYVLSLIFPSFGFSLRPPPKPSFPFVFLCSCFMLDEGSRCLSSLSTVYGINVLVFLAVNDGCVFAVDLSLGSKIL
ncbi:hypothetical protein V6N13_143873 [Hibiscus sabdariffa]|uniref:Uncharacterized protein n=1 Tax=Hibiscus sabdariffa TaxID=183260 RepID=A0ABR2FIX9_9ROSI